MQHSSLVAFLSGDLTPEALNEAIAEEVAAFYAALRDSGQGTIHISTGPNFVLGRAGARRLLIAVATRRLPAEVAVYVADCIAASADIEFADAPTREAVSFIEDDSNRYAGDCRQLWTDEEISGMLALLD